MPPPARETARFLRPAGAPGIEALHATFVNHRYAPHIHDAWTVAHVVSGAARFDLQGRSHLAAAGSIFLIPPGAVHTGEPAAPGGYTYRVLYLEPERLTLRSRSELWQGPGRVPVVVRAPDLARSLVNLHAALPLPGRAVEQGEALSGVCRSLLELIGARRSAAVTSARGHPAVEAARTWIHEHWRDDFSLDELAEAAGLSAFHLVRRFHDQVGMPPSAYRRALRVQAAQRLLRAGEPPAMAALDCGFYDQAHLNRHFKRITGVTPAQYAAGG